VINYCGYVAFNLLIYTIPHNQACTVANLAHPSDLFLYPDNLLCGSCEDSGSPQFLSSVPIVPFPPQMIDLRMITSTLSLTQMILSMITIAGQKIIKAIGLLTL
jgi:hypothetical protein